MAGQTAAKPAHALPVTEAPRASSRRLHGARRAGDGTATA